ncbi:hypothetical protein VTJ04DRAFT_682 [Mycothermus thermophilus]|uniref:uncharacterized protein n=1 Tax=Humicola insolens TaxID=85995 RepID=UPI003742F1E6
MTPGSPFIPCPRKRVSKNDDDDEATATTAIRQTKQQMNSLPSLLKLQHAQIKSKSHVYVCPQYTSSWHTASNRSHQ